MNWDLDMLGCVCYENRFLIIKFETLENGSSAKMFSLRFSSRHVHIDNSEDFVYTKISFLLY